MAWKLKYSPRRSSQFWVGFPDHPPPPHLPLSSYLLVQSHFSRVCKIVRIYIIGGGTLSVTSFFLFCLCIGTYEKKDKMTAQKVVDFKSRNGPSLVSNGNFFHFMKIEEYVFLSNVWSFSWKEF